MGALFDAVTVGETVQDVTLNNCPRCYVTLSNCVNVYVTLCPRCYVEKLSKMRLSKMLRWVFRAVKN
jgi:protein-arginine kinase activator protein McsA